MYSDRAPILCLLLMFITAAVADTAHVTSEIQVGLHTDKTIDSPIAKLLPSGSTLEVIKKESEMSFVRDSTGASGWLDNTYLLPGEPDSQDILDLQKKNRELEQRLLAADRKPQAGAKGVAPLPETDSNSTAEFEQLQQELNSERIRNGELQVELTKLKQHVGQNNDNESLFDKILSLEEANKNLRIQLDTLQSGNGMGDVEVIPQDKRTESRTNWRNVSIYLAVALLAGLGLGVYLMDYLCRRRHGGFGI